MIGSIQLVNLAEFDKAAAKTDQQKVAVLAAFGNNPDLQMRNALAEVTALSKPRDGVRSGAVDGSLVVPRENGVQVMLPTVSGGIDAVIASFAISLVAHFAVGALKSLITIRSWWASGLEMTWIGVIVAVVTYGLGLAFGSLG